MQRRNTKVNVILVCSICLSRNYSMKKDKTKMVKRLEVKKFCKQCNAHTLHKQTI